jgi:Flp pilus assembly protein TadD
MNAPLRLTRASNALARGDLGAAIEECRQALAIDLANPDALHLLGLALRQRGDLESAADHLRRSIELAPRRGDFRVNLGNLLRSSGRLRDAEEQYRIALELEPGSRNARLALARLLSEGGAHAAARTEAQALVAKDAHDAEAWTALGRAQRALGEVVAAESSYRRALALKPGYGVARHNLGALLGELKRAEESLAELDLAAAAGIAGAQLQFNRGRALMELGRLDEAEAALLAAATSAPRDVRSQAMLARLRFMRGDPDYARELAAAASRLQEPALLLALGDLLRRGGQLAAAEDIVRSLLARHGWAPQPAAALAVLLQEQGRLDEAERQARQAAAARPDDPVLAENLLAIQLQRGEAREALELARREGRRAPLDQRWLAYEATAARVLGDPRYQELYDYSQFVQPFDLEPPAGFESIAALHAELVPRLVERHRLQTHPLDQSLRLGTQTTRSLLADPDPVIRAFVAALEAPIAAYRERIGHRDEHPFLARNRGRTRLTGCWSVRLRRGGFHVNHIHPEGWISSAYYVEVPSEVDDSGERSGWIKFGEPRMVVPGAGPAHFVRPAAGRLVLFPSYMWHGTVPIRGDQPRMTIAFDAVTEPV